MLPFPKKKYNLVHRVEKTLPKQLVIHKALVYMTISSFNKKKIHEPKLSPSQL